MNFTMWIDKQRRGSSPGRPGKCRRTRALHAAREARAPPVARVTLTQDGAVITMHEWPPQLRESHGR